MVDSYTLSRITRKALGDEKEEEKGRWGRPHFKDPSWMTRNINKHGKFCIIAHWEVQSATPVFTQAGYEFLCSCSWKQSAAATIYVPGTPPLFSPPALPKQLKEDKGCYWVDQHGARVAKFQYEPMFQSLAMMNPTVRFNDIDIVINRNTLQKLYKFSENKRCYKQYYIDLDMVGPTMFISRRERHAKTRVFSGYGRSFEQTFTAEDPILLHVEGHYRVVRYALGGLNIAVRMEVDGYYDIEADQSPPWSSPASPLPHPIKSPHEAPNELFRNILSAIGASGDVIAHSNRSHTQVIAQGTLVPHSHTLELKCNKPKPGSVQQIWFGRVPHLVYGTHHSGAITALEEVHWTPSDGKTWAATHQVSLRKLA